MISQSMIRIKNFSLNLEKRDTIVVWGLFLIALMIRVGHAFMGKSIDQEIWSDMAGYVNISEDVLHGRWDHFHFFQSIGYPLLIALLRKISSTHWGMILNLLHASMSLVSLLIMYKVSFEWFGKKVGLISLFIGTFHLPWILYTGYALPETFFTFTLALTCWFSHKLVTSEENWFLNSLGWIISFALGMWLKGTHVLLGPLFVLGFLFYKKKKAILPVSVISFVMLFSISIHGVLTYKTIGKIQLSAAAGGLNFVEGKCPSKINSDNLGYSWQSPLFYQLHLDTEKKWSRPFWESGHYFKEGMKCIQNNPSVLLFSLEGIPYLFYGNNLWPFNQKSYADEIRFYELLFTVFAVFGLVVYARGFFHKSIHLGEVLVWVFPILSVFLCVYIFKSEIRYRVPFDTWFIPLGVVGWLSFLRAPFIPLKK